MFLLSALIIPLSLVAMAAAADQAVKELKKEEIIQDPYKATLKNIGLTSAAFTAALGSLFLPVRLC